jgi:hypothetical protein
MVRNTLGVFWSLNRFQLRVVRRIEKGAAADEIFLFYIWRLEPSRIRSTNQEERRKDGAECVFMMIELPPVPPFSPHLALSSDQGTQWDSFEAGVASP